MGSKKRVLLKLTGQMLSGQNGNILDIKPVEKIRTQIKELKDSYDFAIVIGGGNILRGEQQGKKLGLSLSLGHQAGMLATMINGLILKDIFEQQDIKTQLLSSIVCPQICDSISQDNIEKAFQENKTLIFVGGTGAPFFTTDTNAIVRALQIKATQVWKGTNIDGVYSADPNKDANATAIKKINYSDAISQKLGIMDATALILAQKHRITIRVFNIFEDNALIKASQNQQFGSVISNV